MSTKKDPRRRTFREPGARTPEETNKLCAKADRVSRDGYTIGVACRRFGITPETLRRWRKTKGLK